MLESWKAAQEFLTPAGQPGKVQAIDVAARKPPDQGASQSVSCCDSMAGQLSPRKGCNPASRSLHDAGLYRRQQDGPRLSPRYGLDLASRGMRSARQSIVRKRDGSG